jgi:hypothetical protein
MSGHVQYVQWILGNIDGMNKRTIAGFNQISMRFLFLSFRPRVCLFDGMPAFVDAVQFSVENVFLIQPSTRA